MHHKILHRVFFPHLWLLLILVGIGCEPEYSRRQTIDLRDRILDIKDHHGGTRHVSLVNGDQWYQSYGHAIEILNSDDGLRISLIENGPFGSIGPISDMIIANNSLWVVHANDRVVQMDLSNPRRPIAGKQWTAEELGLLPLEVSSPGGMIWISGRNGVTSLQRPGVMYLKDGNRAGRVVEQGRTLVATSGRRIKELRSSKYLGAATELHQIDGIPALSDGFFFVLQGDSAATIGIMNDSFAELDSETVRGTCRSLRMFGDALFAVTDTEIFGWEISDKGMMEKPVFIPIKGARDIAKLRKNYFAVGGTFGRALYRLKADSQGGDDEFFAVKRSPGRLSQALADGRRILAGSSEGNWMYRIGSTPQLSERTLNATTRPLRRVSVEWCEAMIDDEHGGVLLSFPDDSTALWAPRDEGGEIYALEVSDNRIWVGYSEGLVVLEENPPGGFKVAGEVIMEGPVFWLFKPRVGDAIAYVSGFGGLGSVEMIPDPEADENLVRRVRAEEMEDAREEMRESAGLPPEPSKKK